MMISLTELVVRQHDFIKSTPVINGEEFNPLVNALVELSEMSVELGCKTWLDQGVNNQRALFELVDCYKFVMAAVPSIKDLELYLGLETIKKPKKAWDYILELHSLIGSNDPCEALCLMIDFAKFYFNLTEDEFFQCVLFKNELVQFRRDVRLKNNIYYKYINNREDVDYLIDMIESDVLIEDVCNLFNSMYYSDKTALS